MKRLLALTTLLLFTISCTKVVTIPTPPLTPDTTESVKAIAASNLSPDQKLIALQTLSESHKVDLSYLERVYAVEVERARQASDNIKSWVSQLFTLVGTAVSITLAATK
jgi:hypothetical protein